jgi:uncharacterized membrane protein HdeD (DUF308 family)
MTSNEPSSAGNAGPASPSSGAATPTNTTTGPGGPAAGPTGASAVATGDAARREAMCAVLAQNWWAVALRGVFAILFGLVALFVTGPTILSLVLFFSAYMLVDGVFGIVAAVRAARQGERWGLLVLEGLANIAVGAIAFLMPGLTVIAFVLLLAAWSLVSGGLMLGAAFRLSKEHGRWWLAFAGIVSIVFGIVLGFAPVMGAVVLTWWLGAYALAFGVVLLVLAFRLRARKDETIGSAASQAT